MHGFHISEPPCVPAEQKRSVAQTEGSLDISFNSNILEVDLVLPARLAGMIPLVCVMPQSVNLASFSVADT